MGKSTKVIQGGERTLILRVLRFFEEEKRRGSALYPVDQVLKRTCAATGVSLSTVTRIKREEKKVLQGLGSSPTSSTELAETSLTPISVVQLPTPGTKRRKAHNKFNIDDSTADSLRDILQRFQSAKESPSLKKILAVAKEEFNFPGQKETLRKILREKLGYTFKKQLDRKTSSFRKSKEKMDVQIEKKTETEEIWIQVKEE